MNHKYVLFLSQKKKKTINMFFYEGFEVLLFCSFNGFLDELVTLFAICQHVDALSSIFFFLKKKNLMFYLSIVEIIVVLIFLFFNYFFKT